MRTLLYSLRKEFVGRDEKKILERFSMKKMLINPNSQSIGKSMKKFADLLFYSSSSLR
jgi:hypothetical protein